MNINSEILSSHISHEYVGGENREFDDFISFFKLRGSLTICSLGGNFVSGSMDVSISSQEKQKILDIFYIVLKRETLWVVNPYPHNLKSK